MILCSTKLSIKPKPMGNKYKAKEVEEVKEPTKAKLSEFLEAYKKQNPRKFKIKWDRGELKGY